MKPFVIRLLYESTQYIQPLCRTNIGEAVLNRKGEVVYEAQASPETKKFLTGRLPSWGKTHNIPEGRKVPKYEKGVLLVTEAKFGARKRSRGWLTPTARQCLQTHGNIVVRFS